MTGCFSLSIISQAIQVDHENVKATSLKVVFDMLHLYGLEAFNLELRGEAAANRKEKVSLHWHLAATALVVAIETKVLPNHITDAH